MMTREQILASRWVKPFAHHISSPLLWRINRRGIARGVGLGLFAAFAVPFIQTPLALLLAIVGRANLPVAISATFVTNPFTIPFFYPLAYFLGVGILRGTERSASLLGPDSSFIERSLDWVISLAGPTYLGLLVLAVASGVISYLVVNFSWQIHILNKQRNRRKRPATINLPEGQPSAN